MDYKLIATKRHEKTRKSSIIVVFCAFLSVVFGSLAAEWVNGREGCVSRAFVSMISMTDNS